MLIIWGSKIRRQRAGYCLGFCPTCRQPRVHEVDDLFKVGHVYYIPLGNGKFTARELTCQTCQIGIQVAPQTSLALRPSPDDRDAMMADVPDEMRQNWELQMAREIAARQDPASVAPETRRELMLDACYGIEIQAQKDLGSDLKIDLDMVMKFLIWVGIVIGICLIGPMVNETEYLRDLKRETELDGFAIIAILSVVSGLFVAIWYMATRRTKYLKAKVEQPLARALAVYQPSRDELHAMLDDLAAAKYMIAKVNRPRLFAALARAREKLAKSG